ncbi:MAG: glycosyltransferase, partial [Clostridium sp.]
MNILLLTNCIVQPDDIDNSVNDIVFSFAKEWKKADHEVVIINSESRFPLIFYKVPKFIVKVAKKKGNFTIPSLASRKRLEWEKDGIKMLRIPMSKLYPHAAFSTQQYNDQGGLIISYLNAFGFKPDIVTGHWMEPQLKLVNILGDYFKVKKALVVHGELPLKLSEEYKCLILNLDVLFFRSYPVALKMKKKYGGDLLEESKIKVCYSGIPDEFVNNQIERTDWKKRGIVKYIYVGRLEKYKRIDAILNGLSIAYPQRNFLFEIVGNGPENDNILKQINRLELNENVILSGRVPRTEVIKKMNDADCFVMVSEDEVFGLVYLEAMSCGCLTVAAFDGGVDGIINDKKNGFLCEQGNEKKLSEIMTNIDNMDVDDILLIRKQAYNTVHAYT